MSKSGRMVPYSTTASKISTLVLKRAVELFVQRRQANNVQIDKLFGTFFIIEWVAGIVTAFVFSPLAWAGRTSDAGQNISVAVVLGGLIIAVPIMMVKLKPGHVLTRHCVAAGQMLFSALLIHLTGGRIETHFYVFCSLAFLGFYQDWPVLITASSVVAADLVLRGMYYPISIFGVSESQPWRWAEHAWWVVVEDAIIIFGNRRQIASMKSIALKQAEVEDTKGQVLEVEEERERDRNLFEQARQAEFVKSAHMSCAVELSDNALIGQNRDGTIFSWNAAASKLFGFPEGEIVGKHIKILVPSRKQEEMDELIVKAKAGSPVERLETTRLTKDGKYLEVILTRTPLRDSHGNILGVSEFVHGGGQKTREDNAASLPAPDKRGKR